MLRLLISWIGGLFVGGGPSVFPGLGVSEIRGRRLVRLRLRFLAGAGVAGFHLALGAMAGRLRSLGLEGVAG